MWLSKLIPINTIVEVEYAYANLTARRSRSTIVPMPYGAVK